MDVAAVYGWLVPVAAIVMWGASTLMKQWSKHQQEMARIRNTTQVVLGDSARAEFDTMRSELARLRDTTTQYDMSVEHALTEIKRRLATVESKAQAQYKQGAVDDQEIQKVGSVTSQ